MMQKMAILITVIIAMQVWRLWIRSTLWRVILAMGSDKSNYFVDITTTFETKIEALSAHASQINAENIRGMIDAMSRQVGARNGMERAEGFIRLRLFI
jgi:LmbE family N-acetylglucosaminyl deacetylase